MIRGLITALNPGKLKNAIGSALLEVSLSHWQNAGSSPARRTARKIAREIEGRKD